MSENNPEFDKITIDVDALERRYAEERTKRLRTKPEPTQNLKQQLAHFDFIQRFIFIIRSSRAATSKSDGTG